MTLRIEEGAYYRRRDGIVVGPMVRDDDHKRCNYPFWSGVQSFRRDGSYWLDGTAHPFDLIEKVDSFQSVNQDVNEELTAPAPTPNDVSGGDAVPAQPSAYPDDNPKTVVGLRKPSLRSIPPSALLHLGAAMENGDVKYGRFNWRDRTVTSSVYYDAIQRHMLSWWDGEQKASDSGVHHLAHVMACCAILLDAEHNEKLNDDRRNEQTASRIIADWCVSEVAQPTG